MYKVLSFCLFLIERIDFSLSFFPSISKSYNHSRFEYVVYILFQINLKLLYQKIAFYLEMSQNLNDLLPTSTSITQYYKSIKYSRELRSIFLRTKRNLSLNLTHYLVNLNLPFRLTELLKWTYNEISFPEQINFLLKQNYCDGIYLSYILLAKGQL